MKKIAFLLAAIITFIAIPVSTYASELPETQASSSAAVQAEPEEAATYQEALLDKLEVIIHPNSFTIFAINSIRHAAKIRPNR